MVCLTARVHTFETGFRVRLQELGGPWSLAHQQRGTQWFNAAQPGGDAAYLTFSLGQHRSCSEA